MIRTGILVVPEPDEAAQLAVSRCLRQLLANAHILNSQSSPGPQRVIEEILRRWCDEDELDLVITVGGTLPAPGPSRHERVPEATLAVVERLLPGLPEEMRAHARDESPLALLDRGVAGVRGRSLILNLPKGERAALLFFEAAAPLIEPILAYLQEQPDAPWLEGLLAEEEFPSEAETAPPPPGKLSAAEFAAFLAKK